MMASFSWMAGSRSSSGSEDPLTAGEEEASVCVSVLDVRISMDSSSSEEDTHDRILDSILRKARRKCGHLRFREEEEEDLGQSAGAAVETTTSGEDDLNMPHFFFFFCSFLVFRSILSHKISLTIF